MVEIYNLWALGRYRLLGNQTLNPQVYSEKTSDTGVLDTDPDDFPYLALAFHLDADLWSDDGDFGEHHVSKLDIERRARNIDSASFKSATDLQIDLDLINEVINRFVHDSCMSDQSSVRWNCSLSTCMASTSSAIRRS